MYCKRLMLVWEFGPCLDRYVHPCPSEIQWMQDFRQITVVRLHNFGEPRHMIFLPTGEFNVIRLCLRTFPLEENIPRVAAATRGCGPALSSRAEAVRASSSSLPPTSTAHASRRRTFPSNTLQHSGNMQSLLQQRTSSRSCSSRSRDKL